MSGPTEIIRKACYCRKRVQKPEKKRYACKNA